MTRRITRLIGCVSAVAVAAGLAVAVGVGTASSSINDSWSEGDTHMIRHIDKVEPFVGDTVTTSMFYFREPGSGNEKLKMIQDNHPDCLVYVPGSATINDVQQSAVAVTEESVRIGAVDGPPLFEITSNPIVEGAGPGESARVSFSYTAAPHCVLGATWDTWMNYASDLGAHSYPQHPVRFTVKRPSTTALAWTAAAQVGKPVPLIATVTGGDDGMLVEFYDEGDPVGRAPLVAGTATFEWTPTVAGWRRQTAKALGSLAVTPSASNETRVNVSAADVATTTTVIGPATAVAGEIVTLRVKMSPYTHGGTVQFKDGGVDLGPPVTTDAAGEGFIKVPLAAGPRSITAEYTGAFGFEASTSAAHIIEVSPALPGDVSTTTRIYGPSSVSSDQVLTLGVQITPSPDGGTVQFKDGSLDLGPGVSLVDGGGHIKVPLAVGTHSITGVYSGANGFAGSTSDVLTIVVTPANVQTTTTITAPATGVAGASVTLDATVSPVPSGGTVQFFDGAADLGAAVALDGAGKGSVSVPLAQGSRSITAVYSGAGEFLTSTSAVHTVVVTAVAPGDVVTTTVLTVPANAVSGVAVELVATVSPAPAGGTVQFRVSGNNIGAPVPVVDGKATLSHVFPEAGTHQVAADYSGAPGFAISYAPPVDIVVAEGTDPGGPDPSDPGTGSLFGSLGGLFGSLGSS